MNTDDSHERTVIAKSEYWGKDIEINMENLNRILPSWQSADVVQFPSALDKSYI